MKDITNIHIIGCGGLTTHLLLPLILTLNPRDPYTITLHDGDVYEDKNIGRQPAAMNNDGRFKSDTFVDLYRDLATNGKLISKPKFFDKKTELGIADLIIVAVDNGLARNDIKAYAETNGIPMILGANESLQADAFMWFPGQPEDRHPWKLCPELEATDPPAHMHCDTPAAINANPQLPIANQMAATGVLWFLTMLLNLPDKHEEMVELLPVLPSHFHISQFKTRSR